MSPSLFKPGPDPRSIPGRTRLSALPVSIAVHVLLVFAVVVIPLLATDVLPLPNHPLESWMPVAPAPAPPPPPPRAVTSRPVPALVPANPDAAPPVAPVGFAPDDGLDRTVLAQAPHLPPGVVQGEEGGKGLGEEAPPPPPTPTREPVRVGPSIKQPTRLVDVRPVYPEVARQARIEGVVIIEAVIGPTGDVQSARVLRSQPLLDEAALAAVRQWKFTPTLLNGVPVPVVMTVTVNFRLQ